MIFLNTILFLATFASSYAQQIFLHEAPEPWASRYGGQPDLSYTGPLSFAHLPYARCLEDASQQFDIAIIGFPFDTATSYRPGARFGPYAIRSGSRRQMIPLYSWDLSWQMGEEDLGARLLDCGDVPVTDVDNAKAIDQMEVAYTTLISRPVAIARTNKTSPFSIDGIERPRIVTLGGDHTIVLPILRSLHKVYGPVSVIHFDAHLDTDPVEGRTGPERTHHGSYFTIAAEEKLITSTNIHAGVRTKMRGLNQVKHDAAVGFKVISADDLDTHGVEKVIKAIRKRVGTGPVYLSLDIDVIDPGLAPATGTPEVGGWTTREMKRILRGLAGLNFVGADIVEVAPAYDHADVTGIVAADFVQDYLIMMQAEEPPTPEHPGSPDWDD